MRPNLDTMAAYAGRWHTATCEITRAGEGERVFDPDTGKWSDPPPQTIYTGRCLVVPTGGDRVVEFGEAPVVLRSYEVEIPDITVDVWVEDAITITATRDPVMIGRTLVVLDVPKSEMVTVRRLLAEEVLD